MKIEKAELAGKIAKLKNVVPKKTNIPALQGILVKDGYLTASNLELTVKTKTEGAEGELFLIPAKAFDLIGNLPDGEVEISPGKKNTVMIKAAKIKNKYQTLDPETFPAAVVSGDDDKEISIDSDLLLASMKRVSYAIPAQSSNPTMSALCLKAEDGMLNFVGLDGHVLAWDRTDYEGNFELLIPKNTVEKLLSVGLSGEVTVKHNKNGAAFITKDYEVYTRIVDGTYFKYEKMFNQMPIHTEVARAEFLDAVIRAKMCTEEKRPARFEISGGEMNISIKDSTTDYNETVFLKKELTDPLTIGFDARLVVETLKAFDCENVKIQMASPKNPMIVEAEDGDFKAMVLPVAIN